MKEEKIYLTKEGLEKIKKQYQNLQEIKKSKAKGETPEFFHSEEVNPEYLSFQEDLNFLEDQIKEVEYILKNAQLIKSSSKEKRGIVDLGALVLVETDDGQVDEFKIVGSLEANPAIGKISNESPVGKALLGHKIGDKIIVQSAIKTTYKIKKIKYQF